MFLMSTIPTAEFGTIVGTQHAVVELHEPFFMRNVLFRAIKEETQSQLHRLCWLFLFLFLLSLK